MDEQRKIVDLPKLVITDVDGVLTDGGMYYTSDGDVMKKFSVRDGWGVAMLRQHGVETIIMTGENSEIVVKRAKKLSIERCYIGVKDKLELTKLVCAEYGITLKDVAFIGDDINDLPLLRAVGFSSTTNDASHYIQSDVHFVTQRQGGKGAFREFVEKILLDNELLDSTVESLLPS